MVVSSRSGAVSPAVIRNRAEREGYTLAEIALVNPFFDGAQGADVLGAEEYIRSDNNLTDYKLSVRGGPLTFTYDEERGGKFASVVLTEKNKAFLRAQYEAGWFKFASEADKAKVLTAEEIALTDPFDSKWIGKNKAEEESGVGDDVGAVIEPVPLPEPPPVVPQPPAVGKEWVAPTPKPLPNIDTGMATSATSANAAKPLPLPAALAKTAQAPAKKTAPAKKPSSSIVSFGG
jgi:hypothetical protein